MRCGTVAGWGCVSGGVQLCASNSTYCKWWANFCLYVLVVLVVLVVFLVKYYILVFEKIFVVS